jgi:hypothetical protein
MTPEVGTSELLPKTLSSTDFDNHAGSRRLTTDFEVGRSARSRKRKLGQTSAA